MMNNNVSLEIPKDNKLQEIIEDKVYDLIIIGAGPAGLSAAVYAMRKGLSCAVITRNVGGQVIDTYAIENYMGYRFIEGAKLAEIFFEQAKQFPIAFKQSVRITSLEKTDGLFLVHTDKQIKYKSRALLIASGKSYRKLGVKGEKEFTGKGIAYCATCDAPLFFDKKVAVVGGGNSGVEAAIELCKIASSVTLLQNIDKLTADDVLVEKLNKFKNFEVIYNARVLEVSGEQFVNSMLIEASGAKKQIEVNGVFIEIGLTPNTDFVKDFLSLNYRSEIAIDCASRTSVEGVFAAGDVTSVPEKQIIIAAGEGAKASLAAFRYLMTKK